LPIFVAVATTANAGVPYITFTPEILADVGVPEKAKVTLEIVGAVDIEVSYWNVKVAEPVKVPDVAAVRT